MAVQGAKGRPAAAAGTASRWRDALSDERMAHLVKTAFRETSRALQVRLAKHSIQYGHWTLLRVLWKGDGITQRELSDQAGVAEPSAFLALRQMEQLGYVARRKRPGNNKLIRVFLTPKGAALRTQSVAAAEEVNRIALAGASPDDIAAARRVLIAIVDNLEGDAADPSPRRRKGQGTAAAV
jgi:MarR family transcriptional regulator, organic hydroperoxide resistance regulator